MPGLSRCRPPIPVPRFPILSAWGPTVTAKLSVDGYAGTFSLSTSDTRATIPDLISMGADGHGKTVQGNVVFRTAGEQFLQLAPTSRANMRADALPSVISIQINIQVATAEATQLVYLTQPSDVEVGRSISPPVVLAQEDAFGNIVEDDAPVGLTLQANLVRATLDGAGSGQNHQGSVAFSELTLDAAEDGFTLLATSSGLQATSHPFDVLVALGGSVVGLTSGAMIALQNNNDVLQISSNGNFTFDTLLHNGDDYNVLVAEASLPCSITRGQGHATVANVNDVLVTCGNPNASAGATLGGQVLGLGSGDQVILNNLTDGDMVQTGNGNFSFPTPIAAGTSYQVSATSAPGYVCTVANGVGTMQAVANSNIVVTCAVETYLLSGSVNGLASNAQVHLQNGPDTLDAGNGNFAFSSSLAYGSAYDVSLTSPAGQTCAFSGNSNVGQMSGSPNNQVLVDCVANTYPLGGLVQGLIANANVLLIDGNDQISVMDGAYVFPTAIAYAQNYNITAVAPPGQSCAFVPLGSGSGIMPAMAVTDANVVCTPNSYLLGGRIVGLSAAQVMLDNGPYSDVITAGNGNFVFDQSVVYSSDYNITIASEPADYNCTLDNASGTMGPSDNFNVLVTCSSLTGFSLGGTVTGLIGGNVTVTNVDNSDSLGAGNGSFLFAQKVPAGSAYAAVVVQPPGQQCTVTNGNGIMPASNVTNIDIACATNSYTLSGSISGLLSGTTVPLNNGNDNITPGNGNFTFPTGVAYNSNINVMLTQPTGQTCAFGTNSNTGVMPANNDANVRVTCSTNTYTLGGSVAGLIGGNLVTLSDGNDTVTPANGAYTFAVMLPYQRTYSIALTSPAGQNCAFNPNSAGSGTMPASPVTNANVNCTANTYSLGGSVTGLVSGSVTLTNTNNNDIINVGNGNFTFDQNVVYNSNYTVSVGSPNGQSCSITHASGTMPASRVSNVTIACGPIAYSLGGQVAGLTTGSVTLSNTGNADSLITGNGNFVFAQSIAFGQNYNVVVTSVTGHTCSISNANGTMPAANVGNVAVACTVNNYNLGGAVSGLLSSTSVALHSGNDNITPGNGNFTFPTSVAYNSNINVMLTQPTGQTCAFGTNSNTGVMPASNDSNVRVACSTNTYTLGGSVAGLIGGNLVTLSDGNDTVTPANGAYTFAVMLPYQRTYSIALTSPAGQTCVFNPNNAGSGTMPASPVTNANVSCVANAYSLGGSVTGLVSGNVTLTNTNNNDIINVGNGNFTFDQNVVYNSNYTVSVASPNGQSCTITHASGTTPAANVNNVAVACSPNTYNLAGNVSGLLSNTNVILTDAYDTISKPSGNYVFPTAVPYHATYAISITNPTGQTCIFNPNTAGGGTMGAGPVTNANVFCAVNYYSLGGSLSGLASGSVQITNGVDTLTLAANGNFTFANSVPYNSGYNVIVSSNPPGASCAVTQGAGTMSNANVTSVVLTCLPPTAVSVMVAAIPTKPSNANVVVSNGGDSMP